MPRRYRYGSDDWYFEPHETIHTDQGIQSQSQSGKIGRTWWAQQWIEALECLVDAGRLRRGLRYARSGQVLSIQERVGGVTAKVQGSQRTPYRVTISVTPLSDAAWEGVIDRLAEEAAFAAALLAGEMPADVEEAFSAAGVSLFPRHAGDLSTDCSCPDWANPCKHAAATHYILAEQFDADPFLLFRLRGRAQEQILEGLRARRTTAGESPAVEESDRGEPEVVVPLDEVMGRFWQPLERLEGFQTSIKPPAVSLPLLRRLGPAPFLPDHDLLALLGPAYERMTEMALRAACSPADAGENGQDDQA
jgi:uncharacterized Zn finger protein